jgi:hypothetical protein
MKGNLLLCIAAFLILTSCNDFYFKNPQPLHGKALKAIPKELIGSYLEIKDSGTGNNHHRDALVITENSYDLKVSDDTMGEKKMSGTLASGKVVLKKMDDFYVLSQKVENPLNSSRDSVWEAYILEYKNNVLTLYNLASEERNLKVDSVKRITSVKEQQEGDKKYYLINPSNKQFKKLLLNNLYTKVGRFEKVK